MNNTRLISNYLSIFLIAASYFLLSPLVAEADHNVLRKVAFKCDWYHGIQFLGFYVAAEKGYYKDEGLDVNIMEVTSIDDLNALAGNVAEDRIDIGIGSYALPLAQAKGLPLVALASIYQYGPQVFFAKREKHLTSPKDFKGLRIIDKGESWKKLLKEFLNASGLDLSDVVLVKGGFDMTPFYKGEVDIWGGYITNEVQQARLKGIEVDTFPAYEYGLTDLGNNIYSSQDYINKHPDIIKSFLKASVKGWYYAVNHSEESIDILLAMFPDISRDRTFHLMCFDASTPLVIPPGKKIGYFNCDNWLNKPIFSGITVSGALCDKTFLENAWKTLNIE